MSDMPIRSLAMIFAATLAGAALWFMAVGVEGPTCRAPSEASVEALFASCAGPELLAAAESRAPARTAQRRSRPLRADDPDGVETTGSTGR